ncbi:MAG: hypothetical protein HYV35_01755 [Lentisphaerae bacterium]|nr:hypothetical protein [Lentisphaerota bacterium]
MNQPVYAHSRPGRPVAEWQPLEDHLKAVAEKARDFDRLANNFAVIQFG